MTRKFFFIYSFVFAICLMGCNKQTFNQDDPKLSTASSTNTGKPATTFSLSPTKTATQTDTTTPSFTPTPDIWQILECPNAPSIITLDNDWLWEYSGDFNDGQGYLEMLLQFTGKNKIRGFAFDYENIREYNVYGCVKDRSFIMWLSERDTVEAVIRGEFVSTDPRGHRTGELSGDIITGLITDKSGSENL
jgi:hypothetical protein